MEVYLIKDEEFKITGELLFNLSQIAFIDFIEKYKRFTISTISIVMTIVSAILTEETSPALLAVKFYGYMVLIASLMLGSGI